MEWGRNAGQDNTSHQITVECVLLLHLVQCVPLFGRGMRGTTMTFLTSFLLIFHHNSRAFCFLFGMCLAAAWRTFFCHENHVTSSVQTERLIFCFPNASNTLNPTAPHALIVHMLAAGDIACQHDSA